MAIKSNVAIEARTIDTTNLRESAWGRYEGTPAHELRSECDAEGIHLFGSVGTGGGIVAVHVETGTLLAGGSIRDTDEIAEDALDAVAFMWAEARAAGMDPDVCPWCHGAGFFNDADGSHD